MNISRKLKHLFLALVTIGFVIGCAGTTEESKDASGGSDAASAIAAAKAAYDKAKKELYAWRDTGKLIKQAEKALKDGKDAEAIKLANKARNQAELALAQKEAEMNRNRDLFGASSYGSSGGSDYSVVKGDSLWRISGKSEVYGNPYQWPLIYKTNSAKIKDADLIFPGQKLAIDKDPSSGAVAAAVKHAKTRGAWSIGKVEDSDKSYLSK